MDLGFDEFGRPTGTRRQTQEHESDDDEPRHVDPSNPLLDSDSDAFSDDVEIVDGEEATEDITKATVSSVSGPSSRQTATKTGLLIEDRRVQHDAPAASFVGMVSTIPQRLRSIAVVGALHHGKTSLLSMVCSDNGVTVPYRQRKDEIARKMSLKTSLVSVMLAGTTLGQTPSSMVTFVDTPGHPSLACEAAAGLRLADSVLVCVDAVEGVIAHSEKLIRMCSIESLSIALVITKIDRLILDLRLPPMDAYRKLRGIIDNVNNTIASTGSTAFVSPTLATVIFTSSKLQLCFTLETFASQYLSTLPGRVAASPSALAKKLWGNTTYSKETRSFQSCTAVGGLGQPKPSFVEFVLEPVYKVIAHSVTGKGHQALTPALTRTPPGPLAAAKEAVRHFFGNAQHVAASVVLNITPHSCQRSLSLLNRVCGTTVQGCVAMCPMQRIHTDTRSYHVVKVLSGTLKVATTFAVMEESAGDDAPYYESRFESLFIKTPEGLVDVSAAHAGQVVLGLLAVNSRSSRNYMLFQSLDGQIDEQRDDCIDAINDLVVLPSPLRDEPRVLLSVEPVEPVHVTALRRGMQRLLMTSPGLDVRAEETGEFTICGFGEVHLDAALNELRSVFCANIPIKLSAPFVSFAETVSAARGVLALAGNSAGSGSGSNARSHHVGVVSGSLSNPVTSSIESFMDHDDVASCWDNAVMKGTDRWNTRRRLLREQFRWDAIDAQRLIAVGPDQRGPNVLIDDIVEEEDLLRPDAEHSLSAATSGAIVQGFYNALRHGPLCGEPVREVSSRITFLSVPNKPNTEAQTAIFTRQAVTQSLFGARLQLMEPVCSIEMIATPWRVDSIREVLQMRRGAIISETPIPATPLCLVKAFMPLIDSFGFETQLRMTTVGEVFCTMAFDHWDAVPGDPLDASVKLEPLEPARGYQLARDFVLKARYRKGLAADITVPQ
jgi:116 kDa U5 small nuclear ribonucleoprotein component